MSETEFNLGAAMAGGNRNAARAKPDNEFHPTPVEAVDALIREDKDIAILVLASSAAGDSPGELVTTFVTRGGASALHIPVTIVPGGMSDADIEAVC